MCKQEMAELREILLGSPPQEDNGIRGRVRSLEEVIRQAKTMLTIILLIVGSKASVELFGVLVKYVK